MATKSILFIDYDNEKVKEWIDIEIDELMVVVRKEHDNHKMSDNYFRRDKMLNEKDKNIVGILITNHDPIFRTDFVFRIIYDHKKEEGSYHFWYGYNYLSLGITSMFTECMSEEKKFMRSLTE